MEVIEKRISHHRPDIFKVYPIGDIHSGSIHCAEGEIKSKIRQISQEKNSYIIGMGDYADAILKDDKRFDIQGLAPWVRKDNIIECQRKWLRDLFEPVKGKILCLLEGNHEDTIHTYHQDDIIRNLCSDLKVPYGGAAAFVVLTFDRFSGEGTPSSKPPSHQFVIHAWHGAGAAQTEGARIMRLMRLVNEFEADIYLMGHLHAIAQYTPSRLAVRRGRIKSINLTAAITGSWLTTYTQPRQGGEVNPSYGEKKGYKPSRIGCPVIKIDPDGGSFTIEA